MNKRFQRHCSILIQLNSRLSIKYLDLKQRPKMIFVAYIYSVGNVLRRLQCKETLFLAIKARSANSMGVLNSRIYSNGSYKCIQWQIQTFR